MKNLKDVILESKKMRFTVAFVGLIDGEEGMIPCTLEIDSKYIKQLEEFAEEEQDNVFAHFGGVNVEY